MTEIQRWAYANSERITSDPNSLTNQIAFIGLRMSIRASKERKTRKEKSKPNLAHCFRFDVVADFIVACVVAHSNHLNLKRLNQGQRGHLETAPKKLGNIAIATSLNRHVYNKLHLACFIVKSSLRILNGAK
jgi:hypothetical protein